MKLRNILMTAMAAAATLFVSCSPEEEIIKKLDGIKLSSTYITIAKGETTATASMTINDAWTAESPEWLAVDPSKGEAGDYTLTFTALADTLDKGAVLIKFADKIQHITIVRDGDKPKKAGVLFEEPFIGHGQGDFDIKDVVGAPWSYDPKYGMKATAYIDGANTDADSYLISPEIDLTEETVALLSFEQAVNYLKANTIEYYLSIEVTEDNGATWNKLEGVDWPAGTGWDFKASGDLDLAAWLGKKIKFAFHYTSNAATSLTWEVKNVKIANVAGAVAPELSLDAEKIALGAEDDLTAKITATTDGTLAVTGPFSDADCTTALEDAWVSFVEASGVVTVTAKANDGDARTAYLKFSSSNEFGKTEKVATVSQASGLSAYSLPFENAFTDTQGAWTIVDVVPIEGTNIWAQDTKYGMKATAGGNVVSHSDLISPLIDLSSATSPVLSFEHAQKFAGNVYNELTLHVSADNGATWTELQIPVYSDGKSWNYVASGSISLARFVGKQVQVKFSYKSNESAYATWEIKNLKIVDETLSVTNVAEINNSATSSEVAWSGTLTNAVVSYVSGNNAFIEDATGGIQLFNKDGHGLTAGQVINGTVSGKVKLYNGYAELYALDVSAATVTDGEVPAGTTLTIEKLLAGYLHWQNCKVVLEGVTLDPALTASVRNTTVKQGEASIAGYAQIKNSIEIAGDTAGTLVCWPTRYNATLQVGIWESGHFTVAE